MVDQSPTIVQLSLLDMGGDSFHRMRWPGRQLARQAPTWRVINLDFRAEERFLWGLEADLLVCLHCSDWELLHLIEKRKALGKKTLVEINDNFYSPQVWNPARKFWDSPQTWKMYESFMSESDGVIVSGPGLEELLKDKASGKIHCLENHFPDELGEFSSVSKAPGEKVILGWAGSAGHMADLLSVVPCLRDLLKTFPQLHLRLMGDASMPSFVQISDPRFTFTPFGSMQNYFKFWEQIHIGFVPLLDTPYNRCRSDVKAIEISGKGVLPILTPLIPYQKFISETNCPVFRSPQELKQQVSDYLYDFKRRTEDAERCFNYVRSERQGSQKTERLQLYTEFLTGTKLSSFSWPVPVGFHEISGTLEKKLTSAPLEKDPLFQTLIEIQAEGVESSRLKLWAALIAKLKELPPSHRDCFRRPLGPLFSAEVLQSEVFLSLAEEIVDLFSTSVELRLALGRALARRNEGEKGRRHLERVLHQKREFDENKIFFDNIPDYVFQVWVATLRVRTEGQSNFS